MSEHSPARPTSPRHAGTEADRSARIALSYLVEPGCRELGLLVRERGARAALALVLDGGVSERLAGAVSVRLSAQRLPAVSAAAEDLAARAAEQAERLGARIVTPADDEWPVQLRDLARISRENGVLADRDTDPPICLWVRGPASLSRALERSVAIVGARAATPYGNHVAADIAYGLADQDWTVVSGGAFGIDAAAHRATLATGGLTVAVLACGVDRAYPQAHASLLERITEEGIVITEWPPGAAPYRQRFLTRNRVIAGGTRGTVLVEAASRSGARQTLGRARLLGRSAMVVPGPVTSAMSVGCHAELRVPGTCLVTGTAEVIEEVGRMGELAPIPRGAQRPHDSLDPISARLLDAVLPRRARTAEEIAAAAGVSGREARRGLPLLVAAGFVIVTDNGYRLAPARPLDWPATQRPPSR